MILIFNRKDVKNIVPIIFNEGMWACHTENLHKYKLDNVKPLKTLDTLKQVGDFYKENGLNPYGQKSKICYL